MAKETGMLVQKMRLRRGWSQEQLAALCDLNVRTIQRIERGQTAGAESLKALASVFDVDFLTLKEAEMEMTSERTVSAEERLALRRVRAIKSFYLHGVQYVSVVAVLAGINWVTSPHYWWVGWVTLGWGSGVVMHGLRAFDRIPFLTADWERRQVERQLGHRI